MMSEATAVDARLDKLEQDNGRLKLALGALLLAPATAAATSTAGKPMLRRAALATALLVSPGCVNGEFEPDLAFEAFASRHLPSSRTTSAIGRRTSVTATS